MPYPFPPPESIHDEIRQTVEDTKRTRNFNDTLKDLIVTNIRRYAMVDTASKETTAETVVDRLICNFINPLIQHAVLLEDTSKTHATFYHKPARPREIGRGVSKVFLFREHKEYKPECEAIVTSIFGTEDREMVSVKTVAINNIIDWSFHAPLRCFIDPNQSDLLHTPPTSFAVSTEALNAAAARWSTTEPRPNSN